MRNCLKECIEMAHLFVVLFLNHVASSVPVPVLTDVAISALCPGHQTCSQAIFLSSLHQSISGLGTMVVTPMVGDLSDKYGRKMLLTFPLAFAAVPLGVLACNRSKNFVYAYFALKTLSDMVSDGGLRCISLAYVADSTKESSRTTALGILMGVMSLAFVVAMILARILSASMIFLVGTGLQIFAVAYMAVFLDEPRFDASVPQNIQPNRSQRCSEKSFVFSISAMWETVKFFRSSGVLMQIAIITFFSNLGEAGLHVSLLYYLKARFHFGKNQYVKLMLIASLSSSLLEFLVMPFMSHYIGDRRLICIGLLASSVHILLYGIAWSSWVLYVAALEGVLSHLTLPCTGSIVSKQVGIDEQGKAQGLISGVRSFSSVLSPFIISPLTVLFLSEKAPFECPGLSFICASCLTIIAFIQACVMQPAHPINTRVSNYVQVSISQ